jgi:TolB-like protein/DNA-binding winged helix-turn-helix (wHTH) protein/Tfp pilus assembly protein PilF
LAFFMGFEFGGFRLDSAQRRLYAPDGAAIELPSRAFDVLLFMVERPGQLLDKSAILKGVWAGTVVEEGNLSQCVFALRRALGDTATEHRFITTVPGRGYQFVAAVQVSPAAGPPLLPLSPSTPTAQADPPVPRESGSRGLWIALAVGALLVLSAWWLWPRFSPLAATPATGPSSAPNSIAVLPFVDLSPAHDMEYFADGIAEELTTSLAKSGRLRVVGRRSAFKFKDTNADAHAIGQQLNVDSILEGSVRKEGGRIRISALLSRTGDGFTLWTETYDRTLDDVLDLQGKIAQEVVAALQAVVRGEAKSNAVLLTRNADAYRAYLRGAFIFRQGVDSETAGACEEFRRATVLDPQFALAHARLGSCYDLLSRRTMGDNVEHRRLAFASMDHALALDPTIGELWWLRAINERANSPFAVRASRSERALAADPGDSELMIALASTYRRLGRYEETVRLVERAYATDPLWVVAIQILAIAGYPANGDRQRFLDLADESERVAPNSPAAHQLRASLALIEGRALDWDKAVAREVEVVPRDVPVNGYLSLDYANIGAFDAAFHHAKITQRVNPHSAAGWYNLAYINLAQGKVGAAQAIVEEGLRLHPEDFLALRARAELQYFHGDCAGSIESLLQAQPELAQPTSSLDLVRESNTVPMLVWCLRKQGNFTRVTEILQTFERQLPGNYVGGYFDGLTARMAAATGNRQALIARLKRLVDSGSMQFTFCKYEPMIQPYLEDPDVKPLLARLEERRAEWRRIIPKSSMRVPIPGASP